MSEKPLKRKFSKNISREAWRGEGEIESERLRTRGRDVVMKVVILRSHES